MKTVLVEPLTISKALLDQLSAPLAADGHEFVAYDTKPQSEEEWLARTKDCDQLILANTKMPEAVILENPQLRYINIAFTGVDHVPVSLAHEHGIQVTNAAGYSDEAVAELVIGFSIEHMRQLRACDREIRRGGKAADFLGGELAGCTVGIIGTGHIGKRVAELFKAFGSRLLGYNRTVHADVEALGLEYVPLETLLKEADIVTIHLPSNAETKDFLTAKDFALMKEGSLLINCARGPVVNSQDLAQALKAGRPQAAAVDVFNAEPPLTDEPLLDAPATLLTPHIGYFTREAMDKRAAIVFANARNFVEGKELESLVK